VLNRHWSPIHVTTVRTAIVLAYTDRARIVCPESYGCHSFDEWIGRGVNGRPRVRAVHFEIEAPEILVLTGFERMPPMAVGFNRRNLYRRDELTCQYCGADLQQERLTIDHVVPISRGGESNWENCVLACRRCNGRKANNTPREANMRLRRPPKQPAWSPAYAAYARENRPDSWDNFLQPV